MPLPDDIRAGAGAVNPIKHLIRKTFRRNRADTSVRLVTVALNNGYKVGWAGRRGRRRQAAPGLMMRRRSSSSTFLQGPTCRRPPRTPRSSPSSAPRSRARPPSNDSRSSGHRGPSPRQLRGRARCRCLHAWYLGTLPLCRGRNMCLRCDRAPSTSSRAGAACPSWS